MNKLKKLLTISLSVLLMLCVSISLVGCRPYPWEIEEQKIFEEANKIARSSEYALIANYGYFSAEKTVLWEDLIVEKMKSDGKEVENTSCRTEIYLKEPNTVEGGFVAFSCNYNNEFNFFGLNRNNSKHAIGIMSLDDYSFEVHYFRLPGAKLDIVKVSETHFCCYTEDGDEGTYLLINRKNGKIEEEWDTVDLVKENFEGAISQNFNHATYTENGITYTVTNNYVDNEELDVSIRIPSYEYVMERSQELQQINLIANANDNSVSYSFITNGTELFVVYSAMWPVTNLIPVVFRCDTTLETFEYVGCLSSGTYYPGRYISIVKTN